MGAMMSQSPCGNVPEGTAMEIGVPKDQQYEPQTDVSPNGVRNVPRPVMSFGPSNSESELQGDEPTKSDPHAGAHRVSTDHVKTCKNDLEFIGKPGVNVHDPTGNGLSTEPSVHHLVHNKTYEVLPESVSPRARQQRHASVNDHEFDTHGVEPIPTLPPPESERDGASQGSQAEAEGEKNYIPDYDFAET